MKHTQHRRWDCPITFALETFGDPWSLLIIRDIVYFGKNTYGEFIASEEGMATNIASSGCCWPFCSGGSHGAAWYTDSVHGRTHRCPATRGLAIT
jgi:hypothetical protein